MGYISLNMLHIIENAGFYPNSSNKISKYILPLESDNPFAKISSLSDCAHPKISVSFSDKILFEKQYQCSKHRIYAWSTNLKISENMWRILEILNIILKGLVKWQTYFSGLYKELISKKVSNANNGKEYMYRVIINSLTVACDIMGFKIKFNNNLILDNVIGAYSSFEKQVVDSICDDCSCNNFVKFDTILIKTIKISHNIDIDNIGVLCRINQVCINYGSLLNYDEMYFYELSHTFNKMGKYKLEILKKDRELVPIRGSLIYDLIDEDNRIKLLHNICYEPINLQSYLYQLHLGISDIFSVRRIFDVCYICDKIMTKNSSFPAVVDGELTEITEIEQIKHYRFTDRCHGCRINKYGKQLSSNREFIMSRHYKWMSFYCGLFDNKSVLNIIPKDIYWLIILQYQHIRTI